MASEFEDESLPLSQNCLILWSSIQPANDIGYVLTWTNNGWEPEPSGGGILNPLIIYDTTPPPTPPTDLLSGVLYKLANDNHIYWNTLQDGQTNLIQNYTTSSTDNAVVRWNDTTGSFIQNSSVTLSDLGVFSTLSSNTNVNSETGLFQNSTLILLQASSNLKVGLDSLTAITSGINNTGLGALSGNSLTTGSNNTLLGYNTDTSTNAISDSIALGAGAIASGNNGLFLPTTLASVASAVGVKPLQFNPTTGQIGPATNSILIPSDPDPAGDIPGISGLLVFNTTNDKLQFYDGTGYVDASADNLGDHIATMNLNMNDFSIFNLNVGSNTTPSLSFIANANTGIYSSATNHISFSANGGLVLDLSPNTSQFYNNVVINGNLNVLGTTTSINTVNVNIADNYILLNSNYTTNAPLDSGMVFNYLPTATASTITGTFVPGVLGVSNPQVNTSTNVFVVGDAILITGSVSNNGLFECLSNAAGVLIVKGVGLTATSYKFFQNQFVSEVTVPTVTVTKVTITILRTNTGSGILQQGSGSNATSIVFSDILSANTVTLQTAYNNSTPASEIVLNNTQGGLDILDSIAGVGASLFSVQNNAGSLAYFSVSAAGNNVGLVITGNWQGSIVQPVYGGTGLSSYVLGDTIYSNGVNTLAKLSGNTTITKKFMTQTGDGVNSAAPGWNVITTGDIPSAALTRVNDTNVILTLSGSPGSALLAATTITVGWQNELSMLRGGSNAALVADNGGIVYSNASQLQILASTPTANKMLLSGSSTTPSWSSSTIPSSASTANHILISDGTNYILSTPVYPNATTANQLLYSNVNNNITGLATSNTSVLLTNGSGVPSWSSQAALSKVDDTNVTISLSGSPSTALLNAVTITMGWQSQLSLLKGGSNAALTAVNTGVVYSTASAMAIGPAGSNGQILSLSSGIPTWVASSTVAVSSIAGTANQINASASTGAVTLSLSSTIITPGTLSINSMTLGSVFFSGASGLVSQDNNNFFWNDTTNRLGIGTNTPTDPLNVVTAIAIGYTANATNGYLRLNSNLGVNSIQSGLSSTTASAAPLLFTNMNNSTEWMRISATGKVGINTSTPSNYLDVNGAAIVGSYAGTYSALANALIVSNTLGVGTTTPVNNLSVSPLQYSTGTAYQSTNVITGVGTTFTAGMVGSQFSFTGNNLSAGTIIGYTNATTITVSVSQTVGSIVDQRSFMINYTGLQVNSTGLVGVNTSSPVSSLSVAGGLAVGTYASTTDAGTGNMLVSGLSGFGGIPVVSTSNVHIANDQSFMTDTSVMYFNSYYASGFKYYSNGYASYIRQAGSTGLLMQTATTGLAGAAITWAGTFVMSPAGNVSIGVSSTTSMFNVGTANQFQVNSTGVVVSGQWQGTPVEVSFGGSGNSSTTAYAPIIGGTTSTSAYQVPTGGAGILGQVLTSAGPSALPTWASVSSLAVTSISGTANQINASASTGAVTLTLSSTIVTPGTLSINGMTAGSVFFSGASGLVSQDNSNFFWDNTNKILSLGSNTVDTSALLMLTSTTKGFLLPRMNTTQRNAIVTPATGLVIYNTLTLDVETYNGTSWIGAAGSGVTSISGTSNQINASASTGAVTLTLSSTIVTPGTLSINGMTAGSVLFSGASGLVSQDNANLFYDDTNNRLGIGLTNPNEPLTVVTSMNIAASSSSTTGNLRFVSTGSTNYIQSALSNTGGSAAPLLFTSMSNVNEWMRLTSTGSLGIGTGATVSAKVHSLSTTEQLRLGYDAAFYASFTVSSAGNLTIAPIGGTTNITGTLTATTLTLTNPLALAYGGTNAALTASLGGIVYSNATQLQILAGVPTANKMLLSGLSAAPTWSLSTIPTSAGATVGKILASDGTNYSLSVPTFPTSASATAGKIIRSDGTNWLATTATFADTYAVSTLLYAGSLNTVSGLATALNGVLITNASSIPTWLAAGSTGQVLIGNTGAPASWGTLSGITVTSITGTANQINASASTGAVTLTLSSTIVTPGTLSINGMTLGSVFFSGASGLVSQNNSKFFWDNTNFRLSLNTTAPTNTLDVSGNMSVGSYAAVATAPSNGMLVSGNTSIGLSAPATSINQFGVGSIFYNTGTASQLGQNITGVGTTFTTAMIGMTFVFSNGVSAGIITNFGSATVIAVSTSQTVTSRAYTIGLPSINTINSSGALNNGYVGVGTTVPTNPFSAQYFSILAAPGTAAQTASTTIVGVSTNFTSAMIGLTLIYANGVSAGTITAVASTTSMTCSISQTVVAQPYSMNYTGLQVTATGLVGVGTTSPAANLHSYAITEQLRLSYDSGDFTSFTVSSAGDLTIVPSGGEVVITGNEIINSTTTLPLQINSSVAASSTTINLVTALATSAATTNMVIGFESGFSRATNNTSYHGFGYNSTGSVLNYGSLGMFGVDRAINWSGNQRVGIGSCGMLNAIQLTPPTSNLTTTTASQALYVVTASTAVFAAGMVGQCIISYANGVYGGVITAFTSTTVVTVTLSQTVASQRFMISYIGLQVDVSGNVGINTMEPAGPLSVFPYQYSAASSTAQQSASAVVTGVGTTFTSAMVGSVLIYSDGTTDTITAFSSVTSITVSTSRTIGPLGFTIKYPSLQVLASGLVGIGTSAPLARLNVSSLTEQLRLSYTSGFYTSFTISSTGDLTILPSGGDVIITGNETINSTTTLPLQINTSVAAVSGVINMTTALATSIATTNLLIGYETGLARTTNNTAHLGFGYNSSTNVLNYGSLGMFTSYRTINWNASQRIGLGSCGLFNAIQLTPPAANTTTTPLTASQALFVVTASGAVFSAAMVGTCIISYANGVYGGVITSFSSTTVVTVNLSQTVASQAFMVSYIGLQVDTSGNVGISTMEPTGPLSVMPYQYSAASATAQQSASTTVTGVGTTFTSAMVNSVIIYSDGTSDTITAFNSITSITVTTSRTIGPLGFTIKYPGLQVTTTGTVGVGITVPLAKLHSVALTEQLRLSYTPSFYTSFTVSSTGDLTILPSGGDVIITGNETINSTTTLPHQVNSSVVAASTIINLSTALATSAATTNLVIGYETGFSRASANTAYLGFGYNSTGSVLNYGSLGMFGMDRLINWNSNQRVGIGSCGMLNPIQLTPPATNPGGFTASQALYVVTASGGTFAPGMVGTCIISYADGTYGGVITSYTSSTVITVNLSQTVASQRFMVSYIGLQVDSLGYVGVNTMEPIGPLSVMPYRYSAASATAQQSASTTVTGVGTTFTVDMIGSVIIYSNGTSDTITGFASTTSITVSTSRTIGPLGFTIKYYGFQVGTTGLTSVMSAPVAGNLMTFGGRLVDSGTDINAINVTTTLASAGTTTNVFGIQSEPNIISIAAQNAATISAAIYTSPIVTSNANTIANMVGLYVDQGSTAGGTITNAYGVYARVPQHGSKRVAMYADSFFTGFRSTITAASTTTLTNTDKTNQFFTGSTTQTVVLPVVTTLYDGYVYTISNRSSGVVTVQSSGLNTITAMPANTSIILTCIDVAGGTGTASWDYTYDGSVTGGVTSVSGTANQITASPTTGAVILSLPSAIITPGTLAVNGMTAGSVFFSGASGLVSQDNANFFYDDGNNRLGIGNAAPGATLSVGADLGTFSGVSVGNSSATTDIRIGQGSTNNLVMSWVYNATPASATALIETYGGSNNLAMMATGGNTNIGNSATFPVKLQVVSTTEQLRLAYSAAVYSSFTTNISGNLTIAPIGGTTNITGTLTATTLTLTNPLALAYGGTNAALTASTGGIVYSGASAMAILSGVPAANKMLLSGLSAAPTWSTSTIPTSAGATVGKILASDGTNYSLSVPTFPTSASATVGKILRSDGTNWLATTATFADTYAVSTLLYAGSSNTVSGLATSANGVLITNASSVPSWLAAGSTGQVLIATTGAPPSWGTVPASVTSITGTANQINASASTGAVTLTLSSTIITPGTLAVNGTLTPNSIFTSRASAASPYNAYVLGTINAVDGGGNQYGLGVACTLTPTSGSTATHNLYNSCTVTAPSGQTIASASCMYTNLFLTFNVGTVTNAYNIYSDTLGLTASGTVTNAYGIYARAPNPGTNKTAIYSDNISIGYGGLTPPSGGLLVAGNASFGLSGNVLSQNQFGTGAVFYNTGTASQSTTTITGVGTTFTSAMVGRPFIFANGVSAGIIINFTSTTVITVSTSQTVASQGYTIGAVGIQTIENVGALNNGYVCVGSAIPTNPFSVQPFNTTVCPGTAAQTASTTVAGVGTNFTSAMIGLTLTYANGVSGGTITAVGSTTSMTCSISQTVSAQAYMLTYSGLQVSSTGLVGISTTNPTQALEIGGVSAQIYMNSTTSNMLFYNALGAAAPAFTTRSAGTKIVLYPVVDASNVDYAIGIEGGAMWQSVPQNNASFTYRWYMGTTERMRLGSVGLGIGVTAVNALDVSGAVAIGTYAGVSNPGTNSLAVSGNIAAGISAATTKLQVEGARWVPLAGYQAVGMFRSTDALGTDVGAGIILGGVYTGSSTTEFAQIVGAKNNATVGNYDGNMIFHVRQNGSTLIEAMRISPSLGVQIGYSIASPPATSLIVLSKIGVATNNPGQALEIGGTSAQIFMNSATSNMIQFNGNGLAPPTFTTARSVGTKLILFPAFLNGSQADYGIGIDSNTFWFGTPTTGDAFKWYTGITEKMRLNTTGLGILTTATQALEIGGTSSQIYLNSATSNMLYFNVNGVGAPTFTSRSAGTKVVLYPNLDASNVDYAMGIDTNTFWFSAPNNTVGLFKWYLGTTEKMRLNTTGLGILTTAAFPLEVAGSAAFTTILGRTTTQGANDTLYFGTGGAGTNFFVDRPTPGGNFIFGYNTGKPSTSGGSTFFQVYNNSTDRNILFLINSAGTHVTPGSNFVGVANCNLGVQYTSSAPNATLTVGADLGTFSGVSVGNASANVDTRIGQGSANNLVMSWKYNATPASAYAQIATFAGSNNLTMMDAGGNISIGTAASFPTKLYVSGTTNIVQIGDAGSTDATAAALSIYGGAFTPIIKIVKSTVGSGYMSMSSLGFVFNTDTVNNYDFRTGAPGSTTTPQSAGTSRLYINSSGNVGVGTDSTISARLHTLSTTEQLRVGYNAGNYASFTVSSGGVLTVAPSSASTAITGILGITAAADYPFLLTSSASAIPYMHLVSILATNAATTNMVIGCEVGQARTGYNTSYFGFGYVSSGSTSNYGSLGMFGADRIINYNGNHRIGLGSCAMTNAIQLTPVVANTSAMTASQTGYTVTSNTAVFSAGMVGQCIISYINGTYGGVITGYTSTTVVSVNLSQTVTSQIFMLSYIGLQVDTTGYVGINTMEPIGPLSVMPYRYSAGGSTAQQSASATVTGVGTTFTADMVGSVIIYSNGTSDTITGFSSTTSITVSTSRTIGPLGFTIKYYGLQVGTTGIVAAGAAPLTGNSMNIGGRVVDNIANINGLYLNTILAPPSTTTFMLGIQSIPTMIAASGVIVTNAAAMYTYLNMTSNVGTITNSMGLWVDTSSALGGTAVTNAYGIFVEIPNHGTSRVGIYTESIALGYTTTATAAGTTTLTNNSTTQQYFTGATTQTVVLPVTSTLFLGLAYRISNRSSGIVTIQSSGLNTITSMPAGMSAVLTCTTLAGTTAANWDICYEGSTTSGGTLTNVAGTANQINSSGGATPTLSLSSTIVTPGTLAVNGALISGSTTTLNATTAYNLCLQGTQVSVDGGPNQFGLLNLAVFAPTNGAVQVYGELMQSSIAVPSTKTVSVYAALATNTTFSSNVGTVTESYGVYIRPGSTTATGTFTAGYGLRVALPVAGTNKYCAVFEDTVGMGTPTPTGSLDVMSIYYNTGTASQSTNTITGVGTTFTSAMIGMYFTFANNSAGLFSTANAGIITAVGSTTSLTVSTSQTVTSQAFTITVSAMKISNGTIAGNIGMGIRYPVNELSVSPYQYTAGTASQTTTTITGSGTTFTSAMVGSLFVFANGTSAGIITAFGSTTSLTVNTSQSVGSQAFLIHYTGLQVTSTGFIGINTIAPSYNLTVAGNAGFTQENCAWTFDDTSGSARLGFIKKASANPAIAAASGNNITFVISNASNLQSTAVTSQTLTTAFTITSASNIVPGTAALSPLTVTDGFVYQNTMAGVPTGVPTSYTGRVATVYDSSNNTSFVYGTIKNNGSSAAGWVNTNGRVLIAKYVLTGSAASANFTSIPADFDHLECLIVSRSDAATTSVDVSMRFNGDATSAYSLAQLFTNNTAIGANSAVYNVAYIGNAFGATGTSNTAGNIWVMIPCYTNSTFCKTYQASSGCAQATAGNSSSTNRWGNWNASTTINRIEFFPSSGNFVAGSSFYIYGIR